MATKVDVVVVGSGPAGGQAAYRLAEAGLETVVLEKLALPRYKTCGGGVVAAAAALLPIDIDPVTERTCYSAALTDWASGIRVEVSHSLPLVCMTMRDKFDWHLVSAAQRQGAGIFSGREVRDLRQSPANVTVVTDAETYIAKYVVGADGAGSLVADKAGWTQRAECVPALEWELDASPSEIERFSTLRLDLGMPRHGYSWVFPKACHLSVGLLSYGTGQERLKVKLKRYLEMLGLGQNKVAGRHGFVIPVRPRAGASGRGRVLLAGDALGLANPITCEGISSAILSGDLAASAIIHSGKYGPNRVSRDYHNSLSSSVLRKLICARALVPVVYRSDLLRRVLLGPFGSIFARAMVWTAPGSGSINVRRSASAAWVRGEH